MDDLGPREWPVLMTCGPTEFADDFEGRRDSRVSKSIGTNSVVERSGRTAVRRLGDRLGCARVSGDALKQAAHGKGLFVSLATELAYGDLRQFSRRFAGRVKAKGESFTRSLRQPLALNRLYLRAPADWPQANALLEALNQDGDFALEATESDREWMRLTHPHLSNEIYPHLLTAETPRTCRILPTRSGRRWYRARSARLRMLEAFAAGGGVAANARSIRRAGATVRLRRGSGIRPAATAACRRAACCMACWRDAALAGRPRRTLRRALEYIETAETREPGAGARPVVESLASARAGTTTLAVGRGAVRLRT